MSAFIRPLTLPDEPFLWEALYHAIFVPPGEEPPPRGVDDVTPELSIALLPDWRGRGVGSRLLAHMLESARERYPAVCLSVDARNPALRLYQRFGFEISRVDGNTLVMVKRMGLHIANSLHLNYHRPHLPNQSLIEIGEFSRIDAKADRGKH